MTTRRKVFIALGAVALLLCLVAVSIPNLVRSRIAANEASFVGRSRTATNEANASIAMRLEAPVIAVDKKLIRNAELALVVKDVRRTADDIQKLVESQNGEIDKAEVIGTSGGFPSATLEVRVPATGLSTALDAFKKLAVRTEREAVTTTDVTRDFYDNEAHMKNLHAEEEQYLAIMKQAHTVEDTVAVAEKLSDVRDRIERLQADINVMNHDIAMSKVTIALAQEFDEQGHAAPWRPLHEAKLAMRDLVSGLGDWVDWIVAVIIKLPLILLWVGTVVLICWICWKVGRKLWRRLFKGKPASAPSA